MKNKIIIIAGVVIVLVAVIFGVWKLVLPKKVTKQSSTANQYKEVSVESKKEIATWKKYKNDRYKYQISYPNNWYIFEDEANSDFAEVNLGENGIARQGGTVFFSNKDSIAFTQENKPADFLLLGMLIYEKTDTSLDDFAKILGFTQELQSSSVVFKAGNIEGKEYVSLGIDDKNPRIAIIFQKNNNFYVFHLGFVGESQENLKVMEEMVGSLTL
ncbi:MAG: hypothetical protein WAV16_03880 [Candidatus Moraniibacteriota bacterium]